VGLALVTRIPNFVEAQITAGALRSGGIEAQVFDGAFGGMEAPVIEGLGGYRLMAPEEQVEAAREALQALRASPGLARPDDEGPWSGPSSSTQFRRRGMQIIAALFLFGPFVAWLIAYLFR